MACNTKPAITRTFIWVVTISRIPDRQAKKSRIPCPNFGKSRFPESSQISNPVKIFCVFPNPAPYFGQIRDPESTLPDPVFRTTFPETAVCPIIFHLRYFTSSLSGFMSALSNNSSVLKWSCHWIRSILRRDLLSNTTAYI